MSFRRQTPTFLPALPGAAPPSNVNVGQEQLVRYNQPLLVADGYTSDRLGQLEDRVALQERSTATLVERAYKIREDIVDSLNLNHGSWRDEARARELLQEHIRTITDVVRRLNYDVQSLESQLRDKEVQNTQVQGFLRQLEVGQVGGVTDIRGRVLRCDAAIARLTADIGSASQSFSALAQRQQQEALQTSEQFHGVDTNIRKVISNLDSSNAAQITRFERIESTFGRQLAVMESRLNNSVKEIEAAILAGRQTDKQERERMEARMMQYFNRIISDQDIKLERLSERFDESVRATNATIDQLDRQKESDRKANEVQLNEMKEEYDSRLASLEQRFNIELSRIKTDYRATVRTLEENARDMRELFESKLDLTEEQLDKEISQVRRMCVYS